MDQSVCFQLMRDMTTYESGIALMASYIYIIVSKQGSRLGIGDKRYLNAKTYSKSIIPHHLRKRLSDVDLS